MLMEIKEQQPSLQERLNLLDTSPGEWMSPEVFDVSLPGGESGLIEALESGKVATVKDPIANIASDVFEMEHPDKKGDEAAKQEYVDAIVSQGAEYGKWILFPWSKELVRYPDVETHRALRTLRNRDLVTTEEQHKLYDSTIAVFGLSVGSNAIESLVTAGIGGKLIMADMDIIDPSNLNRLPADSTDVGTSKVSHMAKKVSQADPFIDQVHLTDGVSLENLEEVVSNHRPSIMVDAVDSLPIKVAMRLLAQKEGIPVLMATDVGDRSLLDVERYDLGDGKPFNGQLNEEEMAYILSGKATPQELSGFIVKTVGQEHISERMLNSFMRVGTELPGIPQLGATARLGGVLVQHASRELLLGRDLPSGRKYIDPNAADIR